jgi:hypothetical protein
LRVAKLPALAQEAIHKCRLAVIDVSNNHQISQIISPQAHTSISVPQDSAPTIRSRSPRRRGLPAFPQSHH